MESPAILYLVAGAAVFRHNGGVDGRKELALKQLETGQRAPDAFLMLSYGASKLFPVWDPLRDDPCLEKIVQSLAPQRIQVTQRKHSLGMKNLGARYM